MNLFNSFLLDYPVIVGYIIGIITGAGTMIVIFSLV